MYHLESSYPKRQTKNILGSTTEILWVQENIIGSKTRDKATAGKNRVRLLRVQNAIVELKSTVGWVDDRMDTDGSM